MIIGAPFVVYGTQCNFVILVSERRAELSYAVLLGGFMHRRHFDGGFHFSAVSTLPAFNRASILFTSMDVSWFITILYRVLTRALNSLAPAGVGDY